MSRNTSKTTSVAVGAAAAMTTPVQLERLGEHLKKLRLLKSSERLEALLQDAAAHELPYAEFLEQVLGEEVAAKTVIEGGITLGHRLMPSPLYPRNTKASVRTNGVACLASLFNARCRSHVAPSTSRGTGASRKMFGMVNHRSAMAACDSGVQTLMMAITPSSASERRLAARRMRPCIAPSVFMTSHELPSRQ